MITALKKYLQKRKIKQELLKERPVIKKCEDDISKLYTVETLEIAKKAVEMGFDICKFMEEIPEEYKTQEMLAYVYEMSKFTLYLPKEKQKLLVSILRVTPEVLRVGGLSAFDHLFKDIYQVVDSGDLRSIHLYIQYFPKLYKYGEYLDIAKYSILSGHAFGGFKNILETLPPEKAELARKAHTFYYNNIPSYELEGYYRMLLTIAKSGEVPPREALNLLQNPVVLKTLRQTMELATKDIDPRSYVRYLNLLGTFPRKFEIISHIPADFIYNYGLEKYVEFLEAVRENFPEVENLPEALKTVVPAFESWAIGYREAGKEGLKEVYELSNLLSGFTENAYDLEPFWKEVLEQLGKFASEGEKNKVVKYVRSYLRPFLLELKSRKELVEKLDSEEHQRLIAKVPTLFLSTREEAYTEFLKEIFDIPEGIFYDALAVTWKKAENFGTGIDVKELIYVPRAYKELYNFVTNFDISKTIINLQPLKDIVAKTEIETFDYFFSTLKEVAAAIRYVSNNSKYRSKLLFKTLTILRGLATKNRIKNESEWKKIGKTLERLINVGKYSEKHRPSQINEKYILVEKEEVRELFGDIYQEKVITEIYRKFGIDGLEKLPELLEFVINTIKDADSSGTENEEESGNPVIDAVIELWKKMWVYATWIGEGALYEKYSPEQLLKIAQKILGENISVEVARLLFKLPEDLKEKLYMEILEVFKGTADRTYGRREFPVGPLVEYGTDIFKLKEKLEMSPEFYIDTIKFMRIIADMVYYFFYQAQPSVIFDRKEWLKAVNETFGTGKPVHRAKTLPNSLGGCWSLNSYCLKDLVRDYLKGFVDFLSDIEKEELEDAKTFLDYLREKVQESFNAEKRKPGKILDVFLVFTDILQGRCYVTRRHLYQLYTSYRTLKKLRVTPEVLDRYMNILLRAISYFDLRYLEDASEDFKAKNLPALAYNLVDTHIQYLAKHIRNEKLLIDALETTEKALLAIADNDLVGKEIQHRTNLSWRETGSGYYLLPAMVLAPLKQLEKSRGTGEVKEFVSNYMNYLKMFTDEKMAAKAAVVISRMNRTTEKSLIDTTFAEKLGSYIFRVGSYLGYSPESVVYILEALEHEVESYRKEDKEKFAHRIEEYLTALESFIHAFAESGDIEFLHSALRVVADTGAHYCKDKKFIYRYIEKYQKEPLRARRVVVQADIIYRGTNGDYRKLCSFLKKELG